jgi:hypothetical protein
MRFAADERVLRNIGKTNQWWSGGRRREHTLLIFLPHLFQALQLLLERERMFPPRRMLNRECLAIVWHRKMRLEVEEITYIASGEH